MLAAVKARVRQVASGRDWLVPLFAHARGTGERRIGLMGATYRFRCGRRDYISGVDVDGTYEGPFLQELVTQLTATRAPVFFDVGGNVGLDSLIASTCGVRDIHVFEPDPVALYYLRRNLRGVQYRLSTTFVGDTDSSDTITLDTYCGERGVAPTHVKIDIEGQEIRVLRGMKATLVAHHPMLFVEFHERQIRRDFSDPEATIAGFFHTLEHLGYRLRYNGHHHAMRLSADRRYDYTWHDERPAGANCAFVATWSP